MFGQDPIDTSACILYLTLYIYIYHQDLKTLPRPPSFWTPELGPVGPFWLDWDACVSSGEALVGPGGAGELEVLGVGAVFPFPLFPESSIASSPWTKRSVPSTDTSLFVYFLQEHNLA